MIRKILLCALTGLLLLGTDLFAQLRYYSETGGGSADSPFWLHSGKYGILSPDTYLYTDFAALLPYTAIAKDKLFITSGFEGSGSLGNDKNRLSLEQLYAGLRYKKLYLDIGVLRPQTRYDGISSTNGDILRSNNSRSFPGLNLHTDYMRVFPWFSLGLAYGEYMMVDHRVAGRRTHLHHKTLDMRFHLAPRLDMNLGIDHYAQWGGNPPRYGKMPSSFKDYLRVVSVSSGGSDSPDTERINKIGNHIGKEFFALRYSQERWEAEFFYQNLFEDGSGMRFQNSPDGLYGWFFTRKGSGRKWLRSVIYEYYHTTWQSGPSHNDPVSGEVVGGNDNYFNNGVYASGWTYYGMCVGSPFFTTFPKDGDGMTRGICNNRFTAHHFGVTGELPAGMEYRLMASYSRNRGRWSAPYLNDLGEKICKPQLSLFLELRTAEYKWLPLQLAVEAGLDHGKLLKQNNFGIRIKLIKSGLF